MGTPINVSFRVNYDESGNIISVEKLLNGGFVEVQQCATCCTPGPVTKLINTNIMLCGPADPCVEQGNKLWCW